jgi:hypothetical protein
MTGLVPSYTIIPLYPISPLISLVVGILLNQRQSYVSNMVDQSCMVSPLYPFTAPLMLLIWSVSQQNWVILGALVANLPASYGFPMVFPWFSCGFPMVFVSSMYNLSPVFRGIADRVFYTWSRRKVDRFDLWRTWGSLE